LTTWFWGAGVDADAENLKLDGNEKEQSPDDDSRCAFDIDELELESDENEFKVELEATVCRQGLTSVSSSTFHIPGSILDGIVNRLSRSNRLLESVRVVSQLSDSERGQRVFISMAVKPKLASINKHRK
jgi:hypothetical protein